MTHICIEIQLSHYESVAIKGIVNCIILHTFYSITIKDKNALINFAEIQLHYSVEKQSRYM